MSSFSSRRFQKTWSAYVQQAKRIHARGNFYIMRLRDRVSRDVRDRLFVCASRPRQGGVLSHPTWRFQFHFLSRRPPNHCAANPPPEATLRHRSGLWNSQPPHALLFASRRSQMQASSIHGFALSILPPSILLQSLHSFKIENEIYEHGPAQYAVHKDSSLFRFC